MLKKIAKRNQEGVTVRLAGVVDGRRVYDVEVRRRNGDLAKTVGLSVSLDMAKSYVRGHRKSLAAQRNGMKASCVLVGADVLVAFTVGVRGSVDQIEQFEKLSDEQLEDVKSAVASVFESYLDG